MAPGFAHLALATHDMAATIAFYEALLGFPRIADIQNQVSDGGVVRMVYFECGDDQYLVFMEARGVREIPEDFDTGINGALGVPAGLYHFALKLSSIEALDLKKQELEQRGAEVSSVVDHGYSRSIYLRDPNNLQVEFCCMTRPFQASDLGQQQSVEIASPARRPHRSDS
jgi:catechol 2,3-dioxygenase-like lactoylglutathione lyase family enzyme